MKIKDLDIDTRIPCGRWLVYLQIFLQLLFPVWGAGYAWASPLNKQTSMRPAAPLAPEPEMSGESDFPAMVAYALKPHETVTAVAKREGVSLDRLWAVNSFAFTSRKAMLKANAGATLYLPAKVASPLSGDRAKNNNNSPTHPDPGGLAQNLSTLGQMSASGDMTHAAKGYATGRLNQAATDQVQQFLSQFGTARVQLGASSDFSMRGSQLDLLVPLYNQSNHLTFTQWGLRSPQENNNRIIGNVGIGQRYFADAWMLGANTFYDHDFTRGHDRLGVGAEYWRDNLKLGVNGYFGLSGWKASPDVEDYNEKPANGFDLRADAYLPVYPQLGGKLMYEQYYGDEVALFGLDNRQSNPSAVTVGVNYTPVPLVTLGIDRKQGQSGMNDTQFSLGLSYQLGMPWSQQVDPDSVAAKRSLAGSRLDLVERNNNIVLQYQKQAGLVRLSLPATLSGEGGRVVPMMVTATAKHGISRIDWTAPALLAAGGKITGSGSEWYATLPQYAAGGLNTYPVSGIAYDPKGNTSPSASTQISVSGALVDPALSTLTPDSTTLPADAQSTTRLTMTLKASNGQPVTGLAGQIALSTSFTPTVVLNGAVKALKAAAPTPSAPTVSAVTESTSTPGTYEATLTAGSEAGTVVVGLAVSGSSVLSTTVTLSANAGTAMLAAGNIKVILDNALADGVSTNEVRVKVTDAYNNILAGQSVAFAVSPPGAVLSSSTGVSDNQGLVSVMLTNTLAGVTQVNATVNGQTQSVNTTFVGDAGSAALTDGSLTVSVNNAKADNVATNQVQARVVDKNANPVAGVPVLFSSTSPGVTFTKELVTTNAQGMAVASLSSTQAGSITVNASANYTVQRVPVQFVANTDSAGLPAGSVVVTTDNALADGVAQNTVTVQVNDGFGNPIEGLPVAVSATNGATVPASVTTGANGSALIDVTNTHAGVTQLTASANGASQTVSMTFKADPATATVTDGAITVVINQQPANGQSANQLSVLIVDANGNPVRDAQVNFSVAPASQATLTPNPATTNDTGNATVSVTGTKAGDVPVTVSINSATAQSGVTFTADSRSATATLTPATPAGVVADNATPNTVNILVKDGLGNPVPQAEVKLSVSAPAQVTPVSITTDAAGTASVNVVSTQAGTATLTATLANGATATASPVFIANAATAQLADGSLVISADGQKADNASPNQVQATVTDANGNRVSGTTVTFSTASSGASVGQVGQTNFTTTTDASGRVNASVYSSVAGSAVVNARVGGGTQQSVSPLFIADNSTAALGALSVATDGAVANGVATNQLVATVKDAQSNPVSGIPLTLSRTSDSTVVATMNTGTDGTATFSVTSTQAGSAIPYAVTFGSASQPATLSFIADSSTATLAAGSVTLLTNGQPADGASTNQVQAQVTDAQGNPVSGVSVAFSATNSAVIAETATTGVDGKATATLTNTKAGVARVTATANAGSQAVDTLFVADGKSATLAAGSLTVPTDNALANGSAVNTVQAAVTDKSNNPVPNASVTFSTTLGTLQQTTVTTDAQGLAQGNLSSLKSGPGTVTATVNGQSQTAGVSFTPDSGTATLAAGSVTVLTNNQLADGTQANRVQARVTDANGNPTPNVSVSFRAGNRAIAATPVDSDSNGNAVATVTSTLAGLSTVTATVNGQDQSAGVTFIANVATAQLATGSLTAPISGMVADGSQQNSVKAWVTDANGNPLNGITVALSANNGGKLLTPSLTTGSDGSGTASLTNTTAGITTVTATLGAGSQTVNTTFVANTATAKLGSVTATQNGAVADGTATNQVTGTVVDANNNPVPNVGVSFTRTNGATIVTPLPVTTDVNGNVLVSVTNVKAGITTLTGTANGTSLSADTTFIANAATATLAAGAVTVLTNNQPADGATANQVQAVVTDAKGNPVPNVSVAFTVTAAATVQTPSVTTNGAGIAVANVVSNTQGATTVTATVNTVSQTVNVSFVAPPISSRFASASSITLLTYSDGVSYCSALREGARTDWRLPTLAELQQVYAKYPNGTLTSLGWPTQRAWYRSSTLYDATNPSAGHAMMLLVNGSGTGVNDSDYYYVACIHP